MMKRVVLQRMLMAATLVVSGAAVAGAQRPAAPLGQQPPGGRPLEQQVRQALARIARERLKLSDDQMRQLARVDQQFAVQRRQLNLQERDIRIGLIAAMRDTANPDQAKIASYIDQLIAAQRRRIDLVAAEQKELSTFMTPLQRAQYQALQERVRRRLEQLRQARAGQPGGPPPP